MAVVKVSQRTVSLLRCSTVQQRKVSALVSSPWQVNGCTSPRTIAATSIRTYHIVLSGGSGVRRATHELQGQWGYAVNGAQQMHYGRFTSIMLEKFALPLDDLCPHGFSDEVILRDYVPADCDSRTLPSGSCHTQSNIVMIQSWGEKWLLPTPPVILSHES